MKSELPHSSQEVLSWLLEKENPSVQYFALTQLLGRSGEDVDVITARRMIMQSATVSGILEEQDKDGYWSAPERFYTDKYRGTVWNLMILAELGADGNHPQVRKAGEFILQHSQDTESYGFAHRGRAKGIGGLHSEVIPCLTGNMIWSLVKLGFFQDERVLHGIEWICRYQRTDDGEGVTPADWPYDRYEMCWGKHSCHMGVVKSLKALSAIPEDLRNDATNNKIEELAEYLLKHHIFKQSHNPEKVSKPGWKKSGFPLMYQTDILEILMILTDLKYRDHRMKEAIDLIRGKQQPDGKWILENSFNGKTTRNIEQTGKPSKWITLRSLRVLNAFGS